MKQNNRTYETLFRENVKGIKETNNPEQLIGLCPFHEEKHPSFSMNIQMGLWNCKACGKSGNAYQFAKLMGVPWANRYNNLATTIRSINETREKEKSKNKKERIDFLEKQTHKTIKLGTISHNLGNILMGHKDQLPACWNTDLVKEVQIGYAQGSLWFAHHDENGGIVALRQHKGGVMGDGKAKWYLMHHLKKYDRAKVLYICEGEKDAVTLRSIGFESTSVTTGCNSIPKKADGSYDFRPIAGFKVYVIVYDNDRSGRAGAKIMAREIYNEFPGIEVKIAQWRQGLKEKYDVTDSFQNSDEIGDEFDYAVVNAISYNPPTYRKQGVFQVISGIEADKATPVPTEFIIDTLFPAGFNTVIAGETGANKSYLALQEGMSIANNEDEFLGFKINKKGLKVLYVDTESGVDEILRRYQRIQRNFTNWKGSDNFSIMSKGGSFADIWDDVKKEIENFQPDIVYIDCLYNSITAKDISKSHIVSKFTDHITALRDKFQLSIRIIHHFTKFGHADGLKIERMSGGYALQNWAEHVILIAASTNVSNLRLLKIVKARGVDFPRKYYGVVWDAEKFQLSLAGLIPDWRKFLLDENRVEKWRMALERMPETFETKDWLNVVVNELELVKVRQAKNWLREMSTSKIIDRTRAGVWKKTDMPFIDEIIDMEME